MTRERIIVWVGLALLVVATFGPWIAAAWGAEPLVGRATVIDGDTIEIRGKRVRFDGIDAPESRQACTRDGESWRCGRDATFALDAFLAASRPTRCELTGDRSWDRWIGTCFRSDGKNVSEWLVTEGWALDWPKYSGGRYGAAQSAAEAAGNGLWAGEFLLPWEWRRNH